MSLSHWDEGSDSDHVTGLNRDNWLVGRRKISAVQWAKLPRYGREGAVEVRPFTAEKRLCVSEAQGLSGEAMTGNPTTTVIPRVDGSKPKSSNNRRLDRTARDFLLGETILNRGGTTHVPEKVMEALGLKSKPGERSKLLWTPAGDDVIVTKGTPQSDWRKTMLRKNGTAAVPRHVQQALTLKITPHGEERLLWIGRGNQIVVRKGKRT